MIVNKYYNKKVHFDDYPKDRSRESILDWIYQSHIVEFYVTYNSGKSMNNPDCQDYAQEIYTQLCEITQERWDELWAEGLPYLKAYVGALIRNNNISVSSPAYRHIKRDVKDWIPYEDFDEIASPEELREIDRKLQRELYNENTANQGNEGGSGDYSGGVQELDRTDC